MSHQEPTKKSSAIREAHRLHKGQIIKLRISSLAPGGEGVSKDPGVPVFVSLVAPGDLVEVRLFDVRKNFARGEVVSIVEASESRAEPPCPLFKVCGGCQWQHMSYEYQLLAKADVVRQALKHIGKLSDEMVQPTLPAAEPLYYRNKAQYPVAAVPSTGRILAGYYKQNSHELINVKHCPVQPEPMDQVLEAVKEALAEIGMDAYDELTGQGTLRHIAQRYSFAGDQLLLTLVLNLEECGRNLRADLVAMSAKLMEKLPVIIGVCVNYNTARGNRIMGDTTECIAGQSHLIETLRSSLPGAPEALRQGIKFRLSPTSFFQVNSRQAERLLDQVLLAATFNEERAHAPVFDRTIPLLIDAYSGVGTMGMWLAPVCDRVLAIEDMASSVEDGRTNVTLNDLTNVSFRQAAVETDAPLLVKEGLRPDVIVVDPPRKGIDADGLRALIQLGARRIVYVSCNPATLARDLRLLEDSGYKTRRVQPVDMFPQTFHVESVTCLDKT